MNKRNNIPKDSYFVQTYRPNRAGKLILYVAMGDSTKKIQSNFTELKQDYVYIDGDIISLTPIEKKVSILEEIPKINEKVVEKTVQNKEEVVEKGATNNNKKRTKKFKNE